MKDEPKSQKDNLTQPEETDDSPVMQLMKAAGSPDGVTDNNGDTVPTIGLLGETIRKKVQAGQRAGVEALLRSYGAATLTDLKIDDYIAFNKKLRGLGGFVGL